MLAVYSCFFIWTSDKSISVFNKARKGPVIDSALHFIVREVNSIITLSYEAYHGLRQTFLLYPMDRSTVNQWQQVDILLKSVFAANDNEPSEEE